MRRILLGSILLSWIAFLAGVIVRGIGAADYGLLVEMQRVLTDSPAFSLSFGAARAVLTGLVVVTLTAALWALMICLSTGEEERRERTVSLGAAFSWVLAVSAVTMIVAMLADAPHALGMLSAIQVATLASMLAAGGVEIAWEVRQAASTPSIHDGDAARVSARHVPSGGAGFAIIGPPANDREPR